MAEEWCRAGRPYRSAPGARYRLAQTHGPSRVEARQLSVAFAGVAAPAELAAAEAEASACAGRGPALRAVFAKRAT